MRRRRLLAVDALQTAGRVPSPSAATQSTCLVLYTSLDRACQTCHCEAGTSFRPDPTSPRRLNPLPSPLSPAPPQRRFPVPRLSWQPVQGKLRPAGRPFGEGSSLALAVGQVGGWRPPAIAGAAPNESPNSRGERTTAAPRARAGLLTGWHHWGPPHLQARGWAARGRCGADLCPDLGEPASQSAQLPLPGVRVVLGGAWPFRTPGATSATGHGAAPSGGGRLGGALAMGPRCLLYPPRW